MSAFENITKKILEKNERLAEMKKAYMEDMRAEFHEVIKAFFEECPEIQAVVWNQYTPYFNDGEPCTFGVNDPHFIAKGFDEDELLDPYEYEYGDEELGIEVVPVGLGETVKLYEEYSKRPGGDVEYWKKRGDVEYWKKRLEEAQTAYAKWGTISDKVGAFAKILSENEDLLEEVYGDHASVYVTKNRVIVEEYSHD